MFRKGCASSFTGLLVIKERRLNYKPFVTLKDVKTYKSSKSAVLQASDDDHSIDSVLQLGVLLSFTVRETKLSDENIEKNNNNHGHVGKKNKDCQPAVKKKTKGKIENITVGVTMTQKSLSNLKAVHGCFSSVY